MKTFVGFLRVFTLISLCLFIIGPCIPVQAAISATDYFTMTATGTTVTAGATVTFTIFSKDTLGAPNPLTESDFAFIEIHNPSNYGSSDADIVDISGKMTLKASQSTPWGAATAANIAGANDTLAAVNFSDNSVGTVTVRAGNSNFNIFIWAQGAMMNSKDSGEFSDDGTPPGQDMQQITVGAGESGADHLLVYYAPASYKVNDIIPVTIKQLNAGGGIVSSALTDVGVAVSVGGEGGAAHIASVNGIPTEGNPASITNKSLTGGLLSLSVVVTAIGNGLLTITPSSTTLTGMDVPACITIGAATSLTIQGYGPPNGQVAVPTNAPIDIMFNKDPDPTDTIFPLTNTGFSVLSLISASGPVTGQWNAFSEGWGEYTFYRAAFQPNGPLAASTLYTVTITKAFVPAVNLPEGMTALTNNGEASRSFTLTTGTGGGNYVAPTPGTAGAGGFNSGYTGTLGGEFPPAAFLSYPQPNMSNIPTNISCVTVGFDRAMQASSLTTTNIYIKKLVNGTESTPSGTPVVTALQGNESVCISGYTFEANTEYRVIVTRDVRDEKGTQLAGMPANDDGSIMSGMGFGYSNMGPFKEQFKTGAGAGSAVAPNLMGLNINQYKSGASIAGVPTSIIVRASFGSPLNPSTVNSTNVTLKRNGTVPEAGSVFYDAGSNSIEFVPTSTLSANTSYTFAVSTSVTSVSGTAISALSSTFTTGAADTANPQVAYVDADNYGLSIQFNEALNETNAINRSFYTVKTCTGQAVNSDGVTCADASAPTTVSLLSGVTAHYDRDKNTVWMDGLTLTAGDGFYIGVGTGVTDVAGNATHATNNKSWTGFVMDAGQFAGGQGMFNMDTIGMEDFDMGTMGMKPINAMPMNTMAGATTKYFINVPIGTAIPSGGYFELTFPAGFDVSGAKRDAQSPMNSDFNGPGTGTVTFATTLPTITGLTDGGGAQANDGVGYISAARKVIVKLSAATQADDFLHFDLDGIKNSSEPKSFDTSGYSIDIKTFNTANALLEAMSTMPFFISSAGTNTVAGQVLVDATGLNGVKVFLGSPMTGPMEVTTSADGAGTLIAGSNAGEYKFENLPTGQYFVFTEPMFTSGVTDYYGNSMPEPLNVSGAATKNITVTAATATGKATLPVVITFPSLASVASLGFNDSIDIFAFNPSSRVPVIKTVSRTTLGTSPYTVDLFLPAVGDWNVGIGPAMPKGPMSGGMGMMGGWMPPPNMNVSVAAADLLDEAEDLSDMTLAMNVSDKTITGKVLDNAGNAVANAEIYAYDPQAGKNANATAAVDGSFTLNVTNGSYKVGAFLPGLPSSQETPVLVSGSSFYVNGSATASTGSSGANPFNLKVVMPDYTIQGRVATSGGSAIAGAAIWAHRTNAPSPPLHTVTDSSGNYTLYVAAGTWKVEGDAPNYGYLGAKTLTVSTASLSSQNFEVASDLNTITGTINIPGTSDDSGVIVYAYGDNGSAEAKTNTDGEYTLNLPDGTYDINAVIPGTGELPTLPNVVVDGNETGQNFTVATPRTFTVGLDKATTEDTMINLFDANGKGNELLIPAGSTLGTISLPEGTYYLDADVKGTDFEDLTIVGAEFNNPNGTPVTTDQINIDGTGDNITIALPTIYTLTGQVTVGGAGVNDVYVSVFDQSTKGYFGATTSNNAAGGGLDGEYSIKVQAGTYSVSADKAGYTATPINVIVSANSSGNNFALTASSKTVTGTITTGGVGVANAPVWAERNGGGFAATETSTDGTYTLNVDPGVWTVKAVAEGYSESTALVVDVSSTSAPSKNFSLSTLAPGNALQEPTTESIVPSSGGTIIDEGTNAGVILPPNALGTSTDSGQISINETNSVMTTPTANPLGYGYEVSATDADGNPITTLDDDVSVSFQLTLAELTAEGIDTPTEASGITNAYWDDNAGNWASLPTNFIYYDDAMAVIPENTVTASATLAAANVAYVEFISKVDHFTTFAPILPVGATPPATPTGLVATAGDGQVVLTWTKNSESDMSSYNVWEANVTQGVTTTLAHSSCTGTSCAKTITTLTNGTAYSFQIIAVDTDGNQSAGSTAAPATPASAGGGALIIVSNVSPGNVTENKEENKVTTGNVSDIKTSSGIFKDTATHWSKGYVEQLYKKGVISGYSAEKFMPDSFITRAEFTKIIVGAFNITTTDLSKVKTATFKDVAKDSWYSSYIQTAFANNIISGYENGTFEPNKQINRAEAVKILLDAAKIAVGTGYSAKFPDVAKSSWYAPYINYVAEKGIVSGYNDGTFGPNKNLTRAETAKIVSMMLETKK